MTFILPLCDKLWLGVHAPWGSGTGTMVSSVRSPTSNRAIVHPSWLAQQPALALLRPLAPPPSRPASKIMTDHSAYDSTGWLVGPACTHCALLPACYIHVCSGIVRLLAAGWLVGWLVLGWLGYARNVRTVTIHPWLISEVFIHSFSDLAAPRPTATYVPRRHHP